MSLSFELNAEIRTDLGKGASRRLRRSGKIPAVIYGGQEDPVALTIDHDTILHSLEHEAFYSHILTIKVDGKAQQAVLRDLQRHPWKPLISHADFQRVSANDKIHVRVPIHFKGEEVAPGVKLQGGMVMHEMTEADMTCLAKNLPEFIEIDVSEMNAGETLHMSDVKLPEGVQFTEMLKGDAHDQAIVTIHAKKGGGDEEVEGGEEEASEE